MPPRSNRGCSRCDCLHCTSCYATETVPKNGAANGQGAIRSTVRFRTESFVVIAFRCARVDLVGAVVKPARWVADAVACAFSWP